MRLATRLAFGVILACAAVIAASGVEQMRKESEELRTTAEQELRVLAAALQVAIEQALRDAQAGDVQAVLDGIDLRDDTIDIFVLDAAGGVTQHSSGSDASRGVVEPLIRAVQVDAQPIVRFVGDTEFLAAALPLRTEAGRNLGTLAVARPLDALRADLTATRRAILVSFASQVAALALVVWWLVRAWVRRPLAAVAGGMRAVRQGELSARVPVPRHDEIGALAKEFNAMAAELEATRAKLAAETESRRALEQGLQRADKLVTVGQLSAGLAHEIGSPLQVVAGRARSLLERADSSPEVKRQAGIIVAQAERVTRIVEQLLGVTRRSAPRMADADLPAATHAVLDLLETEARRRRVTLAFEYDRDLPAVRADPDRVQQVVLNLVGNALKAARPGGSVRLTLTAARFRHARGTTERHSVRLVVDDDGAGMDAVAAARAFEPFFSSWPDAQGTGLGLAVVKAIVEDHGGTIALRSTPGAGTRVEVHLPLGETGGVKEVVG
ncbi:MAG: HAMP domain-containing protein [bacterium]|nr:HAMP domain-containing protein [bacterium]